MPGIDTTKRTASYHLPPWTFETTWDEEGQITLTISHIDIAWDTKPNAGTSAAWQKVASVGIGGAREARALIGVLQSAVVALKEMEER